MNERPRGVSPSRPDLRTFRLEPWGPPREVMERVANLLHYNEMARGGHFAAFEQPELWAADVETFFSNL